MKKIMYTLATTAIFLSASTIAFATPTTLSKSDSTYLSVINNWYETVRVKEGYLSVKNDFVYPGRTLDWMMFTGTISNLDISYFKNGFWQQIPGCPYGNYNYGVKVYINPAPWDPHVPVCYQING